MRGATRSVLTPVAVSTVMRAPLFFVEKLAFHHQAPATEAFLVIDGDIFGHFDAHNCTVLAGQATVPVELVGVSFSEFRFCTKFEDLTRAGNFEQSFGNKLDLFRGRPAFEFAFPFGNIVDRLVASMYDFRTGVVVIVIDGNANAFDVGNDFAGEGDDMLSPFNSFGRRNDGVNADNDVSGGKPVIDKGSERAKAGFSVFCDRLHRSLSPAGDASVDDSRLMLN